jgi:hypothetical protein
MHQVGLRIVSRNLHDIAFQHIANTYSLECMRGKDHIASQHLYAHLRAGTSI